MSDYDFVTREVADFFREHDRKAIAANRPSSNEEWLTFASNGYRGLFETVKTPMFDAAGQLLGVLGIAQLDEAKRASFREGFDCANNDKTLVTHSSYNCQTYRANFKTNCASAPWSVR